MDKQTMTAEKMLYILEKAYVPDGDELEQLWEVYTGLRAQMDAPALLVVSIYNAGKIAGIRQERQRRRGNGSNTSPT